MRPEGVGSGFATGSARNSERKTGGAAALPGVKVSGTTGTAELRTTVKEEPDPELDHSGLAHPEDREELAREEKEERPDHHRAREPDPRRHVHGVARAVRAAGA